MSKARCYTLTLWDEYLPKNWVERLEEAVEEQRVRYFIGGHERCPDTKRMHWQSYIQFYDAQRYAALVKLFGKQHKFIESHGTEIQNGVYARKDDLSRWKESNSEIIEIGKAVSQGQRTDIERYVSAIREGLSERQLMEKHTNCWAKYDRLTARVQNALIEKRSEPPEVRVYFGETGTGKTAAVYTEFGADNVYSWGAENSWKWWNGYKGQKCILIDEFTGQIPIENLLKLLDRYPYTGETKGGFIEINSPYFILTSNIHPKNWYLEGRKNADILKQNAALVRRIKCTIEFATKCAGNTERADPWDNLVVQTIHSPFSPAAAGDGKLKSVPENK